MLNCSKVSQNYEEYDFSNKTLRCLAQTMNKSNYNLKIINKYKFVKQKQPILITDTERMCGLKLIFKHIIVNFVDTKFGSVWYFFNVFKKQF